MFGLKRKGTPMEKELTPRQRAAAAQERERRLVEREDAAKAEALHRRVAEAKRAAEEADRLAASLSPLDPRQEFVSARLCGRSSAALMRILKDASNGYRDAIWLSPTKRVSADWMMRAYGAAVQSCMVCYMRAEQSQIVFASGRTIDFRWHGQDNGRTVESITATKETQDV